MSAPVLQALQHCLERELELIQEFLVVLDDEAKALAQTDMLEALTASTRHKNSCADRLALAGQEREELLQKMHYAPDRTGLEAATEQHPSLRPLVDQLFSQGEQASQLNATNGLVVETYLKHNQQSLDVLAALTGTNSLYDASGRAKNTPGNHKTSIKAG